MALRVASFATISCASVPSAFTSHTTSYTRAAIRVQRPLRAQSAYGSVRMEDVEVLLEPPRREQKLGAVARPAEQLRPVVRHAAREDILAEIESH